MSKPIGRFTRRDLLKSAAAVAAIPTSPHLLLGAADENQRDELPPVRAITRGPKFHWFSYYDKLQFDPSCRYVLGMEVDFEHRSPKPDDVIRVGMVDLQDNDRWIELGDSRAWCWQQGCMLQWRPGSKTEVLWNDRQGDEFVCHILDVKSRQRRTIPHPIYTVSPDGRWAAAPDFRRVNDMRPGYGYTGLSDPHRDVLAPKDSGVFRIDLDSGEQELIVSLADIAKIPYPRGNLSKAKHYFNHLLISPDGARLEFLHRWGFPNWRGATRMLTAAKDGSDIRVVDHSGRTSHFIWRDPGHILAWSWHQSHGNAFYLFEDKTDGKVEVVGKGVMPHNGHCSYLPGNQWILNDTYPEGPGRLQRPYLYHVATGRRVPLGHFQLPPKYAGEWRCDLHPRFSSNGRSLVIDSPHGGDGRQMHLIDVGGIVGGSMIEEYRQCAAACAETDYGDKKSVRRHNRVVDKMYEIVEAAARQGQDAVSSFLPLLDEPVCAKWLAQGARTLRQNPDVGTGVVG